jgi:AcrR family transcriptional regulator
MTQPVTKTAAECRAQAQRQRILAAAEKCFIEHGFHAASMANIAEAAQMSPGLIYRYFDSKSEIVLAIIDQQLQLAREEMRRLDSDVDLPSRIVRAFSADGGDAAQPPTDPALFLEISAEASRDPTIAAAVRASDQTLNAVYLERLERGKTDGGFGLSPEKARLVTVLLLCLWEGMKVREARQPDFDHALLQAALREILPALLSPEQAPGSS